MPCILNCGASGPSGFPASAASTVISGEILKMIQCHQPLPVGASGSYTVTAKLLVPFGALVQRNSGDTLSPLHPNPLKTCDLPMVPLFLMVGLVSRKSAAALIPGVSAIAKRMLLHVSLIPRPHSPRILKTVRRLCSPSRPAFSLSQASRDAA